jgi:putative ABC transport system permease protein
LLKTIGATGRQIRRIVRGQALVLSAAGIPAGLLLGYIAGGRLAPMLLDLTTLTMPGEDLSVAVNPFVFVFAAAFSLFTVFIGCRKPSRIAAKTSPVEAVKYEGAGTSARDKRDKRDKRTRRVTPLSMAWANIAREKRKFVVIVLSLSGPFSPFELCKKLKKDRYYLCKKLKFLPYRTCKKLKFLHHKTCKKLKAVIEWP